MINSTLVNAIYESNISESLQKELVKRIERDLKAQQDINYAIKKITRIKEILWNWEIEDPSELTAEEEEMYYVFLELWTIKEILTYKK